MNKRLMRGGIALAAAAVLAMTGCANNQDASTGGDTQAAADTSKDPNEALVAAATKLQEQSYKAVIDMGDSGSFQGVLDPKKNVSEFSMENTADGETLKTEMRTVDGVTYLRMTMPGAEIPGMDGKTWRKMGGEGGPGTLGNFDASQYAKSLETAADVKWAGADTLTGTIDLAKTGKQMGLGAADIAKLPQPTIPFEAKIDDEGRLTRYTMTMPAAPGAELPTKMDVTYSEFGVPVDVKAPAANELAKE